MLKKERSDGSSVCPYGATHPSRPPPCAGHRCGCLSGSSPTHTLPPRQCEPSPLDLRTTARHNPTSITIYTQRALWLVFTSSTQNTPPTRTGLFPIQESGPSLPIIPVGDVEEVLALESSSTPFPNAQGFGPVLSPASITRILNQASSDILRRESINSLPPNTEEQASRDEHQYVPPPAPDRMDS